MLFRSEAAVRAACTRLQLPPPEHKTVRLFSATATGLCVQLPGWNYAAVCDLQTGQIQYDNYQGHWGEQAHLNKFLQAYAVEKAKVEARKGDALYLNDGAYGNLFDAAHSKWPFPVKLVRDGAADPILKAYKFYGPTCDSIDVMPGPFWLPEDVGEGDYVEIGMMGAYGTAMATRFNGYGDTDTVVVEEAPMASMYGLARRSIPTPRPETGAVVRLSRVRGKKRRRR